MGNNGNIKNKLSIAITLLTIFTVILFLISVTRVVQTGDYGSQGQRIGAICEDGWRSSSTGVGTCSWHGGVDYWIYRGGTASTIEEHLLIQDNYGWIVGMVLCDLLLIVIYKKSS